MSLRRFPFKRNQEIVVMVFLVLNFSLLMTHFPNFSVIYTLWWDPRDSKETYALIGYQRAQMYFLYIPSLIPKKLNKIKKMLVVC